MRKKVFARLPTVSWFGACEDFLPGAVYTRNEGELGSLGDRESEGKKDWIGGEVGTKTGLSVKDEL